MVKFKNTRPIAYVAKETGDCLLQIIRAMDDENAMVAVFKHGIELQRISIKYEDLIPVNQFKKPRPKEKEVII